LDRTVGFASILTASPRATSSSALACGEVRIAG
jgi:hypothetical protein